MRKIKDIISKPSEALEAMVKGLLRQNKRANFKIDMSTFGEPGFNDNGNRKICYGCAATCTLQEVAGINLTIDTVDYTLPEKRAERLKIYANDISDFESVINDARGGYMTALFNYFNINVNLIPEHLLIADFYLSSGDWEEQIPLVNSYITELKKINL